MNFIPKPRQRNDIAPFGFLAFACLRVSPFFGKAFHWIVVTYKLVCAVLESFFVHRISFHFSALLNVALEKVVCAIRYAFFVDVPLNFTLEKMMCSISYAFAAWVSRSEELMCTVFNAFFMGASLNFTPQKVVCAILHLFASIAPLNFTAKKRVCAIFNTFLITFTHFSARFLRWDNTLTSLGQIVARWRHCLKPSNPPAFHGVQSFMRNAGVLDDFNIKGIGTVPLDSFVNTLTLRGSATQMLFGTARQVDVSTDILLPGWRGQDIDTRIFQGVYLHSLGVAS